MAPQTATARAFGAGEASGGVSVCGVFLHLGPCLRPEHRERVRHELEERHSREVDRAHLGLGSR